MHWSRSNVGFSSPNFWVSLQYSTAHSHTLTREESIVSILHFIGKMLPSDENTRFMMRFFDTRN